MPEGDTLHRTATALARVLDGRIVARVGGSHRTVRHDGRRLAGHRVVAVDAVGKHLVVRFDHGWTLRTHLGMSGSWHTYRPGERWRRTPGSARVVLETTEVVAVCFAAPTVQIAPDAHVEAAIAHLGPDLLGATVDWGRVAASAAAAPDRTVADLLLDQRVAAGIGNVYKSETLFLEAVAPSRRVADLPPEALMALFRRARRLLRTNLGGVDRTTTADRSPGGRLWVYDRAGLPCRRCGTRIAGEPLGDPPRITYWCPRCQPGFSPLHPGSGVRSEEDRTGGLPDGDR